ncbi:hypothetical protein EJD97_008516 [Solanum chilense]|nr:hypothetical protein EJD97_022941 [Solanum chilense]TMW80213.1 hypothetical protein EJD97_022762 [Solanum chilense]TMW81525.1 hypothetical protein EJD97_009129 [Solanum chilense]TMW95656.1 hypothetical protein EJD97_008516 [Solanum chilense]
MEEMNKSIYLVLQFYILCTYSYYTYSIQIVNRGTPSMTNLNLPSIFVPLVGLVFPAIAMASLFLHVQKNKIV